VNGGDRESKSTAMWWLILVGFMSGMSWQRPAAQWAADSVAVTVRTFQFRPAQVEVVAGTRIVWINEDEIEHTATAGTAELGDSLFALALAQKGARAAFTFENPGTYAYHCARHPFMRGVIRVTPKGAEQ
jgi:plastocyanin